MKKTIYLFTAAAVLLSGCKDGPTVPEYNPDPQPMELTGSIDDVAALEKNKAFFLYALLSPGEEWTKFYIDKDNAVLNTDGTVTMSKEYFWPEDDNMYRFIGVMNSADQTQPILDMDGPVVGLTAGGDPASDLLLSNNLMIRKASVDHKMAFRHVMTQVVFDMTIDGTGTGEYAFTGHVANAGKTEATYSALARPTVDVATVAADAADYEFDLEITATETERSPRKVYYLIPDGNDLVTSITGVKLNGNDDADIPLVTEDGEPISLKSGTSYIVKLFVTKGVVSAAVEVGTWVEESLGDQSANAALSEVRWTVSYPAGVDKITKLEIVDSSDKSYFATLDANGKTQSPVDLPATYKELAVWLGNLRVELRPGDYTLVEDALDIKYAFVGTAEQLAAIATDETSLARKYRQAAHIDLGEGEGHTPIGSEAAPFTGEYNGGGFAVTNLKLNGGTTPSGLFGYNSGTVKNVTIAKTTVEDIPGTGGTVCGYNNAAGTIENCINYADIVSTGDVVGGIAGESFGSIADCTNHGAVSSTKTNATHLGGIAGRINGTDAGLSKCENRGTVSGRRNLGGIAGTISNSGSISECVNHGDIKLTAGDASYYIGGITGFMNGASSSVSECTNNGNIDVDSYRLAGIEGDAITGGAITDNTNNGTVTTVSTTGNRLGGIVGTATGVTVTGNKNLADITGTAYTAGGIVGQVEGTTVVSGNENTGKITTSYNGGGIVGNVNNAGGTITGNTNSGDVAVTTDKAGGIAGNIVNAVVCNDNDNSGDVTGSGADIAGVVGYVKNGELRGNTNSGNVTNTATGTEKFTGGIIGLASASTVAGSENTGAVTAAGERVGGILGQAESSSQILDNINKGIVKNTADSANSYTGGICGNLNASTSTRNVNIGEIESTGGLIGGITGFSTGISTISYCINSGNITGGRANVAGIAGQGANTATILACMNFGSILSNYTAGYTYTGGIIGQAPSATATITACINRGAVAGGNGSAGIVGYTNSGATVVACYSVADLSRTVSSANNIGSICGYNNGASAIYSTYWAGNIPTNKGIGYTATANLSNEATLFSSSDWPTEATHDAWKLSSNGGYWESLGEWDAVNPVYPTLAGLPEVPQP